MSDAPYIPFYTSDFLGGTSGMTAATKGVYITLLCLMYEAEKPLHQKWDTLARRCGCTLPAFKKAVSDLQDDGKICASDDGLWSDLLDRWSDWARKAERRPWVPLSTQRLVFERDGQVCRYCGDTDGPFHIDHIVPWVICREHTPENLTVSCASCNWSKGGKTLGEWMGRK